MVVRRTGFGSELDQDHVVDHGKLFVHEESPRETAEALIPTLVG